MSMKDLFDNETLRRTDEAIMLRVQAGRRKWLNPVMIAVTHLGGGVIWWAWYVFIYLKNENLSPLLYFAAAFFSCFGVSPALRSLSVLTTNTEPKLKSLRNEPA